MMKKGKAEAMTAKWRRVRGRLSFFNEKEDKSDTKDDIDRD